jgi:hypothetical protein
MFTGEFFYTFKKIIISILCKFFQKMENYIENWAASQYILILRLLFYSPCPYACLQPQHQPLICPRVLNISPSLAFMAEYLGALFVSRSAV